MCSFIAQDNNRLHKGLKIENPLITLNNKEQAFLSWPLKSRKRTAVNAQAVESYQFKILGVIHSIRIVIQLGMIDHMAVKTAVLQYKFAYQCV